MCTRELNQKTCPKNMCNNGNIWKHQNKHAHTPTGPHPYFDITAPHIQITLATVMAESAMPAC